MKTVKVRRHKRQPKKRIAVRAVIEKDGKLLLIRRRLGDSGGGLWQFVGGKTDGQPFQKALRREVSEEVGLKIRNPKFIKSYFSPAEKGSHQRYYKAKASKNKIKIQKSEVDRYGWFTKREALKLPLTYTAKKYIKATKV